MSSWIMTEIVDSFFKQWCWYHMSVLMLSLLIIHSPVCLIGWWHNLIILFLLTKLPPLSCHVYIRPGLSVTRGPLCLRVKAMCPILMTFTSQRFGFKSHRKTIFISSFDRVCLWAGGLRSVTGCFFKQFLSSVKCTYRGFIVGIGLNKPLSALSPFKEHFDWYAICKCIAFNLNLWKACPKHLCL